MNAPRYHSILNIRKLLYIISLITALISFICCFGNVRIVKGFEYISLLPMIFLLFSVFLYLQLTVSSKRGKNGLITVHIFVTLQWLRLVVLPLLGSISGYFENYGFYVNQKSAYLSTFLICFEAVITFIFCIIVLRHIERRKEDYKGEMELLGNRYIYILFILISLMFFIVSDEKQYDFILIDLSEERVSTSVDGSAIAAIIDYGLTFVIILFFNWCYKNFRVSRKKRYLYYALLCAIIRLCLISSEGRMSQVYLLGAFLLLLPLLFPEYKKRIRTSIMIIAVIVIGLMTVYKVFAAFLYDSYIEAITASSFDLYDMSTQIDVYFYGAKTIARNIEFSSQSSLSIVHLFFDLFRNTFGVHYFFKELDYSTLEYYNLFLYSGSSTSGHLLSSIAYGMQYFGILLAPICTCINIWLSVWVEKKIHQIKYIDVYYIVSILFIRLSLSIFSNFMQTWNVVSRTFVIGMIVIGCSAIFKRRWRSGVNK